MVVTKEERRYMVENKLSDHPSHLIEVVVFLGVCILLIAGCIWSGINA